MAVFAVWCWRVDLTGWVVQARLGYVVARKVITRAEGARGLLNVRSFRFMFLSLIRLLKVIINILYCIVWFVDPRPSILRD